MRTRNLAKKQWMPRTSSPISTALKAGGSAILLATVMACSDENPVDSDVANGSNEMMSVTGSDEMMTVAGSDGLVTVISSAGAAETLASIETTLNGNPAVTVVGTVDHQANAQNVGLEQGPNSVLLFGNPALGTPLMQQNQQAGIDLPQRMHAYENADSEVQLSYNSTSFLQQRHGLAADTAQLATIGNVLMGLAEAASGATIDVATAGTSTVTEDEGLVVVTSTRSFDETYDAFITAIGDTGNLGIFREIDHQANATGAGLELRPTRVVLFGNPNVGTPLMVSQAASGIDLPLKALVYEDVDGNVLVAYNDPTYLAARHGITDQDTLIGNVIATVSGLVATATGTTADAAGF